MTRNAAAQPESKHATTKRGLRRTLGIRPTLIASVGTLVALSAGLIAAISHFAGHSIAGALESRLIVQGLDRLELAVRDQFDAVLDQGHYVAEAIDNGQLNLSDTNALTHFLAGTMAAVPEVGGVLFAAPGKPAVNIERRTQGSAFRINTFNITEDPVIQELERKASTSKTHFWTEPKYRPLAKSTVLGLCVPLREDGVYLGMFTAGIFSDTLSEFTARLSRPQAVAFILLGRNLVLAHPKLVGGSPKMSVATPLPVAWDVGDPALAALSRAKPLQDTDISLPEGSQALEVTAGGTRYRIFLRTIHGYGDVPLTVGVHLTSSVFDQIVALLRQETLIAIALVTAAVLLAIILGRMISLPIQRAAEGVSKIQSLDFDQIQPLGRSQLREIDELAVSFNAMLSGLKSFGRYAPRRLVAQLIREGRASAGSEARELTVMFTDIVSFSSACETMSAPEVADFLNHHLTLVSDCIEAEGGTIDKFIGDAVMAFWGAPDALDNTAIPAARAALAIRTAIRDDNRRRAKKGLQPVRMRIGIHTGPLVVGDIGTTTRLNYTVVGDVVNGAQRLEAAGKEIDPDADVAILIGQTTADRLPPEFERKSRGRHKVKGKEEQLEVYQLV